MTDEQLERSIVHTFIGLDDAVGNRQNISAFNLKDVEPLPAERRQEHGYST